MSRIELAGGDDGATRRAHVGDVVAVSLPESPGSGYRWAVEDLPAALAPDADEFTPDADAGVGGGGIRTLGFRIVGPGRAELKLRRLRSWEGERSVVERFGCVIRALD